MCALKFSLFLWVLLFLAGCVKKRRLVGSKDFILPSLIEGITIGSPLSIVIGCIDIILDGRITKLFPICSDISKGCGPTEITFTLIGAVFVMVVGLKALKELFITK